MQNNNNTREAKWWNTLSEKEKLNLFTEYAQNKFTFSNLPNQLAEWEIKLIYNAEHPELNKGEGGDNGLQQDWDLYPGNEAGAFDHLDHDPGTFPLDIPGMDDEEREIEKLEADLWNQPTGTPPISTPENDGYILFSLKRPSAGKIKYWHDGEKTGTYDVEMDIVIELGRLPKMWKPMPLEQVTPKVVSFK